MSQTNKPIKLLLALNVAEGTSKKNIQTYINKLQKDLSINLELQYSMDNRTIEGILDSIQTALQELPLDLVSESISYGLQDTYEQVLQLDEALMSLNTTWSTLVSQSSGGLTLTQELVVLSQGMQEAAGSSENLIDVMGYADSGFSLLGTNLKDASEDFTDFIEKQRTVTTVTSDVSTSTSGLTTRLTALATAANVAKVAIRGFAIATGVGLAYAAVSFVIEKTAGAIADKVSESKRKAAELAAANQEIFDSYKNNEQAIDSLVLKYEELNNKMQEPNPDNKTIAEYRDIQNEIAELLPSLASGVDAYGNKIILSHEALRIKIDLLKEELAVEKEKARLEEENARNSRIPANETENDNAHNRIDTYVKEFTETNEGFHNRLGQPVNIKYVVDFVNKDGKQIYDSADKLSTELLPKLEKSLVEASRNGSVADMNYLDATIASTKKYIQILEDEEAQLNNLTTVMKLDYIHSIESIISTNDSLSENSKELASTFTAQMLNLANPSNVEAVSKMLGELFTSADYYAITPEIIQVFDDIENASEKSFVEVKKNADELLSTLPNILKSSGFSDSEISSVMSVLNQKLSDSVSEYNRIYIEAKKAGVSMETVRAAMAAQAAGGDAAAENFKKFSDELKNATSEISSINKVLEDYNSTGHFTSKTMTELLAKYPTLINYIGDEAAMIKELTRLRDEDINVAQRQLIEKLETSNDFYTDNIRLIEEFVKEQFKFYQGDLDNWSNLAQLKADVEMQLMHDLADKWGVYYDETKKMFTLPTVKSGESYEDTAYTVDELEKIRGVTKAAKTEQEELNKTFNNFSLGEINIDFKTLGTSTNRATKATKENNKATKEAIYITDEYAASIRELDKAIAKQQDFREDLPKHSESYRKSLEEEIKLEKQKLALQEKQAEALRQQMASGNIKQTGNVTIDKNTSKTTTTTKQNLKGWSGPITSQYGSRQDKHTGIDIDGKIGDTLESNISGKVYKAGNAKDIGEHSSYGNLVIIQDEKNNKHYYAHLNNVSVVKGQQITAGTKIGTIGNSGTTKSNGGDGSHLHYEIRNSKGKTINPSSYIDNAKKGIVSTSNSVVSTTPQSRDEAKVAYDAVQTDMVATKRRISDLTIENIGSDIDKFNNRRKILDDSYAFEEAKLKNINRDSSKYNATLNKQIDILKRKQNVDKEEIAFYEELLQQGDLSEKMVDELTKKIVNLKTSVQSSQNEIGAKQLEDRTSAREYNLGKQDQVIEYEKAKIQELDKSSQRYVLTLEKINKHTNRKMLINQKDLDELNQLIASGEYSGEVLQAMKNDASALSIEIKNLAQEINNNNFEIVANIKANADERVDDLSDKINVLKTIRNLYKEGSVDYVNNVEEEIKLQQELAEVHDNTRRQQAEKLKDLALYPEQIKQATEMMEDSTAAYWNAKVAVDQLTKSLEESKKKLLDDTANKVINAYKEYVQERRDQHIDMIDQELKKEKEASDKRKKAIQDELDLFRRSVQEKLQLLDRQEAGRSYQMDIDELESERTQVIDQMDILALDDSYEAKAKRKQLQEKLDSIDKNIAEKRHSRDIDLQKEALNDLLTDKEDNMREREELEDEHYQKNVARLEKEKENLQKHYNDLLNDERKFTQIRTDIANKHYDEVIALLEGYINEMNLTMPELATTLDGTMITIGTSIRENVIDSLKEAIKAINTFRDLQKATSTGIESFDPNEPKKNPPGTNPPSAGGSNTSSSLNSGDYKVLFGKFLSDVVRQGLPMGEARDALKNVANEQAAQGRLEYSKIKADSGFSTEFKKLSKQEQEALKNYIRQNANILNGSYQDRIHSSIDSLSTNRPTAIIANSNTATLAKVDTTNLLENSKFSDGLTTRLSAISDNFSSIMQAMSSPFQSLVASTAANADTITVNFNIDKMNGDMNDLKKFNKMMNDELLRKKGIK